MGNFNEILQCFFDCMVVIFGFVWYYDGIVLCVMGVNEVQSVIIVL